MRNPRRPRKRKSRESETEERDSRIYPRLGSPIMSISNTTNCTQPSGESGRFVVARVVSAAASSSSPSPSPSPCNGLLNSPSKIVLSFQSTRRRYDAPRSTSLPYNFQFPRGLPSKGIDRVPLARASRTPSRNDGVSIQATCASLVPSLPFPSLFLSLSL